MPDNILSAVMEMNYILNRYNTPNMIVQITLQNYSTVGVNIISTYLNEWSRQTIVCVRFIISSPNHRHTLRTWWNMSIKMHVFIRAAYSATPIHRQSKDTWWCLSSRCQWKLTHRVVELTPEESCAVCCNPAGQLHSCEDAGWPKGREAKQHQVKGCWIYDDKNHIYMPSPTKLKPFKKHKSS